MVEKYPQEMSRVFAAAIFGLLLNIVSTFSLNVFLKFGYLEAYFSGTVIAVIFTIFLSRKFSSSFMNLSNSERPKLLVFYLSLCFLGVLFVYICAIFFNWSYVVAVLSVILLMSFLSYVFVGLWIFVRQPVGDVAYEDVSGEFYDETLDPKAVGRFRAKLHCNRFKATRDFIKEHYTPGQIVLDFACGSCSWNIEGLPVVGLDVNDNLLNYGISKGRLSGKTVGDIYRSPFPDNYADVVISSQAFEHLKNPGEALKEIWRVLKPGGVFLIDVPYDLFFGPFFILFNTHCLIQGYLKGRLYYKQRCGHINYYTKSKIRNFLTSQNFKVEKIRLSNFMILHASARKL